MIFQSIKLRNYYLIPHIFAQLWLLFKQFYPFIALNKDRSTGKFFGFPTIF